MRKLLLLICCSGFALGLFAQELNFSVTVNTPKLQTADPAVFRSLEIAVRDFMNNTKWTDDEFEIDERIRGSIIINVNEELSATRFTAEMAIQSVRPIYGSNQETPMLNYQDNNVWFEYEQFQPLVFSQNVINDNLTALLAFYAYVIIGLDYDSFAPMGGEPFFQQAQQIVNIIPPAIANGTPKGWRAQDGNRNRYWIIENILSPRARNMRQGMYEYHRQGIDLMHNNPAAGRAIVLEAMNVVNEVKRTYPTAMILQMFSDAKSDELIEIFKAGNSTEKNKLIQIMTRVDGSRAARYRAIR